MKSLTHKAILTLKFVGLFSILLIYDGNQRSYQDQEYEESQWMTSYSAAKKKAELENKSILIHFTDTELCDTCLSNEEKIFQHPAFISFAKENLVLLRLSNTSYDESNISSKNVKFESYNPNSGQESPGNSMVFIMDKEGKILTETGIPFGGVHAFIGYVSGSLGTL